MLRFIFRLFRYVACAIALLCIAVALVASFTIFVLESKYQKDAAPETTRFVPVDGEELAIRIWPGDEKDARTILMVGGLSAWADTWVRTVEEQRARGATATFIALDLPPFGYSIPDGRPYHRRVQAERIAGLIDTLDLKRVTLVGHSYGGGPVTEYALTHEGKVDAVVLVAPVLNIGIGARAPVHPLVGADVVRTSILSIVLRLDSVLLGRFRGFVYKKEPVTSELLAVYTRSFDTKGTSARLSQWVEDYLTDPLQGLSSTDPGAYRNFKKPVRFIWGEEDTLTPIADGRSVQGLIEAARLTALKGIGHIPMVEDPAVWSDALAEALQATE